MALDPQVDKQISLTKGKFALVDAEDYEVINQYKWTYHISGYGYRNITLDNGKKKTIYMHRFILDCPSGMEVDHINGDKLDNRKSNLRICTHAQNNINSPKRTARKYKGVYKTSAGKWQASLKHKGKMYYFGVYESEEVAAKVYNEKAIEIFGEFANLNELDSTERGEGGFGHTGRT